MPTIYTKNQYSNMQLGPGIGCLAISVISYCIYDSYTGISAFLTGILFIPIAIITLIFGLKYMAKYIEVNNVPDSEWEKYIKNERILFSLATYKHPQTGDIQTVRRGFSIHVFLIGGFYPLFKGQFSLAIKFFIILIAIDFLCSIIPVIGTMFGHILSSYGIARRYNKYYEDWLIEQGYILQDSHSIVHDIKALNGTK